MDYDTEFWNNYTLENKKKDNEEFSKFIRDLVISLHAKNVLEIGCNIGNDLKSFPENFHVNGVDLNENAINIAKERFPSFKFQKGSIFKLPYEDSSIDFVFTHNVLNYINENDIDNAIKEMYRISKKYILNCEIYDEKEEPIEGIEKAWKRNVFKRWLNFQVKIISNVEMHEDIEPNKPKFTLVRKIS